MYIEGAAQKQRRNRKVCSQNRTAGQHIDRSSEYLQMSKHKCSLNKHIIQFILRFFLVFFFLQRKL